MLHNLCRLANVPNLDVDTDSKEDNEADRYMYQNNVLTNCVFPTVLCFLLLTVHARHDESVREGALFSKGFTVLLKDKQICVDIFQNINNYVIYKVIRDCI